MQIKWFERTFDFSFGTEQYDVLYSRLKQAPAIFGNIVASVPEEKRNAKPGGKWSVKEHIGHIVILEALWLKRLKEIKTQQPIMSPTDLNNAATDAGAFNNFSIKELVGNFANARHATMLFLDGLDAQNLTHSSIHPRMQKPMRIIDKMYFVAEHDNHHLSAIRDILDGLQ